MQSSLFIAIDLGAGSGRVFLAGVEPGEFYLDEIHRCSYPPRFKDGNLRWDLGHIFAEIKKGLRAAAERARDLGKPIRSIGIDSWAVDYALLNDTGELIADPVCYRDDRTIGAMERVFAAISKETIFEKTGIQFQNFNTLYQLSSDDGLNSAKAVLLLPDLLNFFLTGKKATEYTNATTTQLVNAKSCDWDDEIVDRAGLKHTLLQPIIAAGTELGPVRTEIASELRLNRVTVIAPATHDTASAVAGAPLEENSAYISSGTWSLIGVELDSPLINAEVAAHNFTNEGGVYGSFRFLKNVMGLWIFESCRREWIERGMAADYDTLLTAVERIEGIGPFIFPDDPRFLNPPSMLEAIAEQLSESGQKFDAGPPAVSKIVFDSLAFRYASVLRTIAELTGNQISNVQIVGGGGRNRYLNQMTANTSGLTVYAGLFEATVVGNVLVQAVTSGRFTSLAVARDHVRQSVELTAFSPAVNVELAAERYSGVEARYLPTVIRFQ
jgi:rhamnulokinase